MLKMVLVAKAKRPPSINSKRRAGLHHKHSNHYLRPYWPYLPLALIVGIGLIASSIWGHTNKSVLGYATSMSVNVLLQDTNHERESNSLGDLTLNNQLNQAAQAKANDMATGNYWSHNTPSGATPWTFIISAGYQYETAGENLAYGFDSSDATVAAWMNSPEHRANILGTTYKEVGFGVADAANYQDSGPETIVVAMYASPQPSAAVSIAQPPVSTTTTAPSSTPATPTAQQPASAPEANATTNPISDVAAVGSIKPANTRSVTSKNVARIQLLSGGQAPWLTMILSVCAAVCLVIFIMRHAYFWHRKLRMGEQFIIKHRLIDMILVALCVLGFVLTRSAGIIH